MAPWRSARSKSLPQIIDSQTTQNSLQRKGSAGNFYAKDIRAFCWLKRPLKIETPVTRTKIRLVHHEVECRVMLLRHPEQSTPLGLVRQLKSIVKLGSSIHSVGCPPKMMKLKMSQTWQTFHWDKNMTKLNEQCCTSI